MDNLEQQLTEDLKIALEPIKEKFEKYLYVDMNATEESESTLSTYIHIRRFDGTIINLIIFSFKEKMLQTTSKLEHRLIYALKMAMQPLIDKYKDSFNVIVDIFECDKCVKKEHDWEGPMTEDISEYYETSEGNPNNIAAQFLTFIRDACKRSNNERSS